MIDAAASLRPGRSVSLHETLRDQALARRQSIDGWISPAWPRDVGDRGEGDAWNLARIAPIFGAIEAACRLSGGLACGDDLARRLEDRSGGDFVTLARMLSADEVFGIHWLGSIWIPVFQFDLNDLSVKRTPQKVRSALGCTFDDWEVATWFTSPNLWLRKSRPVDLLESDSDSVLEAARADRFVAEG